MEWDQPGDGLLGCATIADGTRNVLELHDLCGLPDIYYGRSIDNVFKASGRMTLCEADLELGWEILREAARLHCGVNEHEGEEDDGWTEVREFGRHFVRDWIGASVETIDWAVEGF